jgi:hypothetical protein
MKFIVNSSKYYILWAMFINVAQMPENFNRSEKCVDFCICEILLSFSSLNLLCVQLAGHNKHFWFSNVVTFTARFMRFISTCQSKISHPGNRLAAHARRISDNQNRKLVLLWEPTAWLIKPLFHICLLNVEFFGFYSCMMAGVNKPNYLL